MSIEHESIFTAFFIFIQVTNNAKIWRLYAELVRTDSADHKCDIEKVNIFIFFLLSTSHHVSKTH